MAKRTRSELKNYFQAGKRPTEGQFEDFIDSYVDISDNYTEKNDLKFTFPHHQSNQAVDILLGNVSIYGWLEVEIVGFYNYQNSVGVLKKQFVFGAFPDNDIWYPSGSRIIEASGEIADNIYIGDIIWDNMINQYKITVYHTNSNGNDYTLRLVHHSTANSIAHTASLSQIYTNQLTGQRKHYVHYDNNVGIGTKNPQSKLQILSSFSTPDQQGSFSIGDTTSPNLRMGYNDNHFWIQTHSESPLYINPLGNNTILNKDGGNVGIGTANPAWKLDVNGVIKSGAHSNEGGALFLENSSKNAPNTANRWAIYNMTGQYSDGLQFWSYSADGAYGAKLKISDTGNMALYGKLEAKDVVITPTPTADFVFDSGYDLKTIDNLEQFITKNHHLPDIPSAKEMTENGLAVGDFQIKLLQKIEELTLYVIDQNKQIEQLKSQIK